MISDLWNHSAVIAPNNFVHKSLSNWAFNIAVGCSHACRFCYVPDASAIKLGKTLARFGVEDPDAQWGDYVLLRPWDEKKFLASLRSAESTPISKLKPDGNRAIIYCSTTDAYQVIRHADPKSQQALAKHRAFIVRRSLELIRDQSSLNVRILTRSPLAKQDFDLFQSFGSRLVFGMSLPTLRNDLSGIYEPRAAAPSQRMATMLEAKQAALNVFIAMAPTYPECDETDLRATLKAVAELEPITIFHEPINIRAENVLRMKVEAARSGVQLKTDVFASRERWQDYAIGSLKAVERISGELGISDRIHLWPDKSLGSHKALQDFASRNNQDATALADWLNRCWSRISKWPASA